MAEVTYTGPFPEGVEVVNVDTGEAYLLEPGTAVDIPDEVAENLVTQSDFSTGNGGNGPKAEEQSFPETPVVNGGDE